MKDDDRNGNGHAEPHPYQVGDLADGVDVVGLVRRYERHAAQTSVTLDQILAELRAARTERATERDRVDNLERDFVEHREYVANLTAPRKRAAGKK